MKNAIFSLLMCSVLFSCTIDPYGGTEDSGINLTALSSQAQRVTQYNNPAIGGGRVSATFSYDNGKLLNNDKYTFERSGNTTRMFDVQVSNTNAAYIITHRDGRLRKFQSMLTDGYFEVLEDNNGICTAEWRQCSTCEAQKMRFTINDDENIERVELFDLNGRIIADYHYTFDHYRNPFFKSYHLPDQFLTDLEYIVRVFSCNNVITSTLNNYSYEYNENGYPRMISIEDNQTKRFQLTKEISY